METTFFPPESFKALKPKARKSLNRVKALSLMISGKLGDNTGGNTRFYLKCAWHLSESQIAIILERAHEAKRPISYFLAAASSEMRDELKN